MTSFIKAFMYLISEKYNYTIVTDHGFGNERFAQLFVVIVGEYVSNKNHL